MIKSNVIMIDNVPRSDCDPSGYAHHAKMIEWCERGRVAILRDNGITVALAEQFGYYIATGKIIAEYKSPIKPDDAIVMHTTVLHINTYKIKTLHRIYRLTAEDVPPGGELYKIECAEITVTTLFVDSDFVPKQLPEAAWEGEWDHEAVR